jgi:hypothetical protein
MELKKGENIIEHESEIYSRPARTWFQSGKEKLKAEGQRACSILVNLRSGKIPTAAGKNQHDANFDAVAKSKQKAMNDENKVCFLHRNPQHCSKVPNSTAKTR